MSKKMALWAVTAVSAAIFALPAVAAAQSWHLNQTTSFSITGSGATLTSSSASAVTCTGTSGSGTFSTTTSGTVSLRFSNCKEAFGLHCGTPGSVTGVFEATAQFDAIMVAANKPGILLTPDTSVKPTESSSDSSLKSLLQFAEGACVGRIFGKGIIGTLSIPACGAAASTATMSFSSSAAGVPADQTWTGGSYNLRTSSLSASVHPTWSIDSASTVHFPAARTFTCT